MQTFLPTLVIGDKIVGLWRGGGPLGVGRVVGLFEGVTDYLKLFGVICAGVGSQICTIFLSGGSPNLCN